MPPLPPARLRRLTVEDFGLIRRVETEFADGLTVFSGETGSGKTMVLGALAFALGERASAEVVRSGAERARVTLEVDPDPPLAAALADEGLEIEADEPAIFSRELLASGKSNARINGRPVTAGQLRLFGERIVDIVGQHAQQRLLSPAYHLDVLDRFGGPVLLDRRERVGELFSRLTRAAGELDALIASEGQLLAEQEFAAFALREIEAAQLVPGEDVRLRERREYLTNAERILTALRAAHETLAGEDGASASETLGAAAAALASIERYGASLAAFRDALVALQGEVNEIAARVARELDDVDDDPAELEQVMARLETIDRLKRKHGGSIEAVLEAGARFRETIDRFASRDERIAELTAIRDAARRELDAAAAELSRMRLEAARELERRVNDELAALAMPAARFRVAFTPLDETGARGAERLEFELAANPGEPPRSLARTASGGELSRVLLALVVVLAERRERTTLVFDEIDAGIGGATANAVGLRLGRLAARNQVLCVTHLAQIASWADEHVALRKIERNGAVEIRLVRLEGRREIAAEIARMLSGTAANVALQHAETLLRDVHAQKERGFELSA